MIFLRVFDAVLASLGRPGSFRALYKFTYIAFTTIDLPAHAVQVYAIFHGKINTEIIKLITGNPSLA